MDEEFHRPARDQIQQWINRGFNTEEDQPSGLGPQIVSAPDPAQPLRCAADTES